MTRYTVQCGYAAYFERTETVEAATLDDALEQAIAEANAHSDWASADVCDNTFIAAVAEGEDIELWGDGAKQLPVPARFTEGGEGPRVTVILRSSRRTAGGAVESVSIQNGTARVEVRDYDRPDRADADLRTDPEGRRYAFTDWSNVIPSPDKPAG